MTTPKGKRRRRFKEQTVRWTITQPKTERDWLNGQANPCGVGAVEILRDALAVYQTILQAFSSLRGHDSPTLDEIITFVRAALTGYIEQERRK